MTDQPDRFSEHAGPSMECDPHPPLPTPAQTPYAEPHWDALQSERLLIQECVDCGERQHFPRPWCRNCASETLDWIESDGRAELYSYSVPRRPVEVVEYEPAVPYVVGLVDLDVGVRVVSTVVNCDIGDVEIGMDLQAVYDHVTEDVTLVRFEPA
ncbi:OB-fold domain-containing protein [Haloarculaceae archaeon H-GB2-1]|nr:OB-fold domain-containing protein [Haloarculaceae archaeon H-GB1-1]MEA5407940.1 OB-fold domain-containing protein [Haloarculaceae archaeon H-GB2-1]